MSLVPAASDMCALDAHLPIAGMELEHRITVARLLGAALSVHSPVEHSAALVAQLLG
jgi:hypothetical protein